MITYPEHVLYHFQNVINSFLVHNLFHKFYKNLPTTSRVFLVTNKWRWKHYLCQICSRGN